MSHRILRARITTIVTALAAVVVALTVTPLAQVTSAAAAPLSSIAGTVRLPDGSTAANVTVDGWRDPQPTPLGTASPSDVSASTDAAGRFVLRDLEPGTYSVCVTLTAQQPYATNSCQLSEQPYTFDATITVGANQALTGQDVTMLAAGAVSGRVLVAAGGGRTPALADGLVDMVPMVSVPGADRTTTTAADGTFTIAHVPAGMYTLRINGRDGERGYWRSSPTLPLAEAFTVTEAQTGQLGTGTVAPGVTTERIAGADRFDTAVAVSKALFPGTAPDVPVEYVVNGTNYADALSAGPAAGRQGGGLLLVAKDVVPASTASELRRLKPQRIVIAGGPAAVSPDVERQLAAITGVTPERQAGDDRYATSLAINAQAFPGDGAATGASQVLLATGRGFADALAAGPAAIHLDAPILLVDGTTPLTSAQRSFLQGVGTVDLIGGTAVISPLVATDVARAVPAATVQRLAGDDRFATSVAMNHYAFGTDLDRVYLATGTGFADALSGGPLVGWDNTPLYLTAQNCVPQTVLDDIDRVNPSVVTLLGGPNVITDDVLDGLRSCG